MGRDGPREKKRKKDSSIIRGGGDYQKYRRKEYEPRWRKNDNAER